MKIILTGFAPFGGETVNPSYEAIKLLPDEIDGCQLIKLEMPVSYDACPTLLEWMISLYRPDAVMCFGQASGRTAITPEYVAINLMDSNTPDNSGMQYNDQPVISDAPTAYFTKLPVRKMVDALRDAGIPGFISYTCGTYVCNCLMYHLLHLIDTRYPSMKGGFIHVPYSVEQVMSKSLPLFSMETKTIARGIEICIASLIRTIRSERNTQ